MTQTHRRLVALWDVLPYVTRAAFSKTCGCAFHSLNLGDLAACTIAAAVVTLLFLYNLITCTGSHTRTVRVMLGPTSHMVNLGGIGAGAGGSRGGSIAQQLLSELAQGPTGSLLQQYILPLTNFSSVSAAQLPLLLQGTNFTSLSTAAVLDAAGSRLNSQQKWQLANMHQKLFCT